MKYFLLFGLITLFNVTQAQKLTELLPQNPLFVFGIADLEMLRSEVIDFSDSFENLEVGSALTSVIIPNDNEEAYENFAKLWISVCDEAWLAWLNTPLQALPAFITLARITPDNVEDVAALLADPTAKTKKIDNYSYQLVSFERGSNIFEVMAYALVDEILFLSSDEATLRNALGALTKEGKNKNGFANSEGYKQTIARLKPGQFYNYFDYGQLAGLLEPLIQNLGMKNLTERLTSAFTTAGVSAGVSRLTEGGFINESIQLPNAKGGDKDLYRLLTKVEPASNETLAFVPANVFAFSSGHNNLVAWWRYIDNIVKETKILGGGLDDLLLAFFGIDVQNNLLSWADTNVTTVTTSLARAAQPGIPSQNLLGEVVYIVGTDDEEATKKGLAELFAGVSQNIAAFADPQGGTGNASNEKLDIAGTTVNSFSITGGVNLSYAVSNGYALIATSLTSMQSVLETQEGADTLEVTEAYKDLVALAPEDANSIRLNNMGASMNSAAEQLSTQLQLFAGLGGAANLDFDQVEKASAAVKNYLNFLASCIGYNVAYTQISAEGAIHNYGKTQVTWQCAVDNQDIY